jgi:hypothetical protein
LLDHYSPEETKPSGARIITCTAISSKASLQAAITLFDSGPLTTLHLSIEQWAVRHLSDFSNSAARAGFDHAVDHPDAGDECYSRFNERRADRYAPSRPSAAYSRSSVP